METDAADSGDRMEGRFGPWTETLLRSISYPIGAFLTTIFTVVWYGSLVYLVYRIGTAF